MLDEYTSAPITPKLRATLRLLQKMTLDHQTIGADDVRAVLQTGVSKRAVEEALEVAFLFNIYDRLADAMGWHIPAQSSGYYQAAARRLLTRGYA